METSTEFRRLTKSRTDRMIDGVCGGVAAYAGVDATLVRLAWVLLTLLGGSGILLYIAAMILIPKEQPAPGTVTAEPPDAQAPKRPVSGTFFWGILLVGVKPSGSQQPGLITLASLVGPVAGHSHPCALSSPASIPFGGTMSLRHRRNYAARLGCRVPGRSVGSETGELKNLDG
jgi:phage shock protein C